MNITADDFKRLSEIRVEHCKNTKKDAFANFAINVGGVKAVSNIAHDNLEKEGRVIVNDAKERINLHYDDDYIDPFFKGEHT